MPVPAADTRTRSRIAGAVGATAGALWLAFRGVDINALAHSIATMRTPWLIPALLSVVFTVAAAVVRWQMLVSSADCRPSWLSGASGLVAGQMVNILLPIRLGEVVRTWIVARDAVPAARVVAAIVIEKLLDICTVGAVAMTALAVSAVPSPLVAAGHALVTLSGMAMIALVALVAFPFALRPIVPLLRAVAPSRWRPAIDRSANQAID